MWPKIGTVTGRYYRNESFKEKKILAAKSFVVSQVRLRAMPSTGWFVLGLAINQLIN
jgi:hypothetical protein